MRQSHAVSPYCHVTSTHASYMQKIWNCLPSKVVLYKVVVLREISKYLSIFYDSKLVSVLVPLVSMTLSMLDTYLFAVVTMTFFKFVLCFYLQIFI